MLAQIAQEPVGFVDRYRRHRPADLHLDALAVDELDGRDGVVQEHLRQGHQHAHTPHTASQCSQ